MENPLLTHDFLRLWKALGYSLAGLKSCYRSEAAFRQEIILFVLLLPVLLLLPVSLVFKLILLTVNCLVLITELVNSAIEAVVNMVSPEFSELAGRAKDMGSAAVLLTLALAALAWSAAIYTTFTALLP